MLKTTIHPPHLSFALLIETKIDKFLEYYRDSFPQATVLPKMHMLESFLKQWKIGLGFLGEQGAESIHSRWNIIKKNYTSTRPPS